MEKPELSIIMPAIRKEQWDDVYDAITKSTTREFELIIVGPHTLTDKLRDMPNIKYVKDFGNLVRCFNIAAMMAEGKYLTSTADDGRYHPHALDMLIKAFESMPYNPKNIIEAKYTEAAATDFNENYFKINAASETRSPFFSDDWYFLLQNIMYRDYFIEMGGLDYRFEILPMGIIDFAVRAYRDGANVKYLPINIQHFTWMCGKTGDHAPVDEGQCQYDIPLFQKIHHDPNLTSRGRLNFFDWKKSDSIWHRRFNSTTGERIC